MRIPPNSRPFHVMVKPRGAICNLDCSYCYYLQKEELYPGSSFRMSSEVLEEFTRQYIEAQPVPEVIFGWQGGEPLLMGLDFFREALALQARYRRPGMRILNTLQTNGTKLDEEWSAFFAQNGFLVGISLDGPEELHDAYRVDKGGKPTFRRVMEGLRLLKAHGVEWNALTTIHAANAPYPLEVYRFLRDEAGARFMQFIPIVERERKTRRLGTRLPILGTAGSGAGAGDGYGDSGLTDRSVSAEAYGRFLTTVFDEWVRRDVAKVFVQMFDVALSAWVGAPPPLCVFAETCGTAAAMEHNGDLYSCDHFVDPLYRLGNLRDHTLADMMDSPRQRTFGEDKRDTLPRYCRECEVRFVCNGGCPKDRLATTPDGEPGLNVLCAGYKGFFNHIRPAMEYMADALRRGRAPAGIMDEGPEVLGAFGGGEVEPLPPGAHSGQVGDHDEAHEAT